MALTVYQLEIDGDNVQYERREPRGARSRRGILKFALAMSLIVFVPTTILAKVANDHPIQSRSERLAQHCTFERMQLSQDLDDAIESRVRAASAFNTLVGERWREVEVCMPNGAMITTWCGPGDRSCIAGAFTTALARITY